MKKLLLLVALSLLGALAAAAQRAYPAAIPTGAAFAADRGQYFDLLLDGQPLTRRPVPQVQVAALAPGQHWAEFRLPGSRRRDALCFRASVWLEPGFETQFVLYLRPGYPPQLRREGAVALLPPAPYPGTCGPADDDDRDDDHGGHHDDHGHDYDDYGGYGHPQNGPGYGGNTYAPGYSVMSPPDVAALLQALQRPAFDGRRLDLAKQALGQTVIRADDFREVLRTFDFDASRAELATFAYPYVADRQNFYRVYAAFDFERNARSVDHRLNGF